MLNFWIVPVAALIPMILGFVWYHEKAFGKTWMAAANMTPEKIQSGNMPLIFGTAYVLSCFLAFTLLFMSVHQTGVYQLLNGVEGFEVPGTEATTFYESFIAKYGSLHRGFGHGMVHGAIAGFMFALPVLATNALFERKGLKYILVNCGYWIVCTTLMGGVLCQFA